MSRKPKRNQKADTNESSLRDRCQTPDYALDPLFHYLKPEWTLWEPARGEGYLERALLDHERKVVTGDILTGQNYFDDEHLPTQWDAMVTNPPFSVKFKWLERAYRLGKPFALIVPLETVGASAAINLFRHYGSEWIMFDKRIDYGMPNIGFENSHSQFPSIWLTWGLGIGAQVTYWEVKKRPQKPMTALKDVKLAGQLELFGALT
jgi:hypothetical protein